MPDDAPPSSDAPVSTRSHKLIMSDLPPSHYTSALQFTNASLDTFTTEKDVATSLKKEFDNLYAGTWQAIVGSCFGCSLTHKTKAAMHFQIQFNGGVLYVLLFQSEE